MLLSAAEKITLVNEPFSEQYKEAVLMDVIGSSTRGS